MSEQEGKLCSNYSDLRELAAQAAAAPQPDSATALRCKYADTSDCGDVVVNCEVCKEPLCEHHRSESDASLCVGCAQCIVKDTLAAPLIDDDGVTHADGQLTIPSPHGLTYRTLMQRICEMDDYQLEAHIIGVQRKIKEIETILDYRRIDLASSQCEFEDRGTAKRKKLRLRSVEALASGAKVITMPGATNGINGSGSIPSAKDKALAAVAAKLRTVATLFNLPCKTPEDMAKIALIVRGMNKPAASQAAQAPTAKP